MMGLVAVRGLSTFLSSRWSELAAQNVAYDLRNAIYDKLQSLSFSYHDQAETGQLLSRAVGDVDRVRFLTGRALLHLVQTLLLIAGVAVSMLAMNARLGLLTLALVPFLTYTALEFGRRFRPLFRAVRQQMDVLNTRLEQNLRGARIVTAFAQEEREVERFDDENARVFALNLTGARLRATSMPLMQLLASAGTILVLLYGGLLVIRDQLTLGELVAFTAYVGELVAPVRRLGWVIASITQAVASGERIFEILDAKSEVEDMPGATELGPVRGRISFEDVSFAYLKRERVLQSVDFEAQPGQVIALLGTTGSGKSTVINLIPRFYDPTAGRILLDGQDIREVTVLSLRRQIGIVMQDTTLFAASVRENIAFGRPDASQAEIEAAAQAASAHDFVMELPEGYDSYVGERGVTLSGGQKQRVAIARAILKDPRILILDDATSSVDTETEAAIQAALERLMEGRTSFVIAQRLSTVRKADQVLVLDRGRIVACATRTDGQSAHEQLLRSSGLYAEIYYGQLRPQEQASELQAAREALFASPGPPRGRRADQRARPAAPAALCAALLAADARRGGAHVDRLRGRRPGTLLDSGCYRREYRLQGRAGPDSHQRAAGRRADRHLCGIGRPELYPLLGRPKGASQPARAALSAPAKAFCALSRPQHRRGQRLAGDQ
jgi:ATP-binding cassette subfamily B protein